MAHTMPDTTRLQWNVNTASYGPVRSDLDAGSPRFIKGPLPLPWFQRAAALPGKALHVALAIWYVRGLCRADTFPLKRSATATLGVSADATYDALSNLEAAGLVRVQRHRGRSPVVTVLDSKPPP